MRLQFFVLKLFKALYSYLILARLCKSGGYFGTCFDGKRALVQMALMYFLLFSIIFLSNNSEHFTSVAKQFFCLAYKATLA